MNGQEQKERNTAVAKLERRVEEMEAVFHDLWSAELEARQKGEEHLKEMFASMLDQETQFRQRGLLHITHQTSQMVLASAHAYGQFMQLNWWRRWGWCIFGHLFLIMTDTKSRHAYFAARAAEKLEAQEPKPPVQMSEENFRKARASSERPQ